MNLKSYLKTFLRYIPSVIMISISWYLSSQEHVEHMPSFWNADKVVHFVCFGGLCMWLSFACRTKSFSKMWIPVSITSLYGFMDEIHQSFVPGRYCSFWDWVADTSGAILGAVLYITFTRLIRNRKKS